MTDTYDIIIYSVMRWDQPMAGSSLAIAKELSKTHRVFFVDRPYSIKDLFLDHDNFLLRKRVKAILFRKKPFIEVQTGYSNFVVATPGVTLPINFLPAGILFNFLNWINAGIVKNCIKRMAKEYEIKEYVYLNYFNPVTLPILKIKGLKNIANLYYVTHDIHLMKYMWRHGVKAQEKAIALTDMVLVSSKHQFKKLFSKSIQLHYFPNAVDFKMFDSVRQKSTIKPYDMINIGQTKVIMFCGYLSKVRIDYKLLKLVCDHFVHHLIVVIGPYDEADLIKHKLDQISNLIILGSRRYEAMPSYMKCANVTIIPYLCNELNKSVYPLKLNEYLAMGKPVVTTNFSPDLDSFSPVIFISKTYEEFLSNLETALKENEDNLELLRVETAALNSWTKRVEHLMELINQNFRKSA